MSETNDPLAVDCSTDCDTSCRSHQKVMRAIGRNRTWIVALLWAVGIFTLLVGLTFTVSSYASGKASQVSTDFGKHVAAEKERDKSLGEKIDAIHDDLEKFGKKQDELFERVLTNH